MNENALKPEVSQYSRLLWERGWVANHDGNISARLGEGRFLCTPTAVSKRLCDPDTLIVVDETGAKVSGRLKPFSEVGLHLTVYRNRPDVNAVIHAHPPTATGFAVAQADLLGQPLLPEAVVSLGAGVPLIAFAAPGPSACQALAPFVAAHDAVLLANHGVLAWGADLEQAFLRLELVEHLAKIALVARQVGGARALSPSLIPALLESRRKAGLGLAASSGAPPAQAAAQNATAATVSRSSTPSAASSAPKTVIACAPAPPGSDVEVRERPRASVRANATEIADIIRQEIAAALRK